MLNKLFYPEGHYNGDQYCVIVRGLRVRLSVDLCISPFLSLLSNTLVYWTMFFHQLLHLGAELFGRNGPKPCTRNHYFLIRIHFHSK